MSISYFGFVVFSSFYTGDKLGFFFIRMPIKTYVKKCIIKLINGFSEEAKV